MKTSTPIMALGTTIAGKYKILGELGRGGMGEVYLAEDISLARKVALKFLPEDTYQDQAARSRFLREAMAAAALDHPYICSIHEVGESEGKLFFAMEYVEGKTLHDRISAGALPLQAALPVAIEVAEALLKAHESGIIHRDIKPANIMLMEKGHAKVMDFGLAKQVSGAEAVGRQVETRMSLTEAGSVPGTPAYMSPEQLRGEALDPRSDIFSFGIVFYEMLTGAHPFKKETGLATISAILGESPKPITDLIKNAPDPLPRVVSKMLAKDPGQRYQSMAEVIGDLKKILSGLPVLTKVFRLLNPVRVAAAASILIVAVIAASWLAKTVFFKSAAKALAFQERDWILIADFENQTGEQVFEGSLETALTVGIQQSQYVNVFPRTRVQETLKRMRKEEAKKIDESLAAEIALREGIKAVLACSIGKIGDEYLLTARIINPDTQSAVYSGILRAAGKERVLDALDELGSRLRRELGESLAKVSRQKVPLPRATTSSLEALKFYTEGKLASWNTALMLLQQAIDLDPDFALAHAELGLKYYIHNNRKKGEEHFQRALSLLDRLTAREKLWIQAIVEDWRGNREKGIENYRAYVAQYPDDGSAWFRLGYAYLLTQRNELGLEAFRRVIELNSSSAAAYINLATILGRLEKNDEAVANYQKAFDLRPEEATHVFVNNEYGFLLVKMGRVKEAEQTFEKMLLQDNLEKKEKGHRSLALLDIYLGKHKAAQEHLEEAVRLATASKGKLSELRDRLYLGQVHLSMGHNDAFEKEMDAVKKIQGELKTDPYFIYLVGRAYARMGRIEEAVLQLENLKSSMGDLLASSGVGRSDQSDQADFYRLKGEVEVALRLYDEAINSFGTAASLGKSWVEESLGYAFWKSGDLDKAAEKYEAFLKSYRIIGNETLERWILAHYELAQVLEQKGQPEEAIKYYERFLEIWKDGDPDLPVLIDAKKRLAKLKNVTQTPKTV
jgi:serine/threonine protein kinase/Tfp pilus assembly protein PilF